MQDSYWSVSFINHKTCPNFLLIFMADQRAKPHRLQQFKFYSGGESSSVKCFSSAFDQENVWLISSYVLFVWENIHVRGAELKLEQFFGF